jgi:UDPglucose--hexose-1-phosphate uridylyltransferase
VPILRTERSFELRVDDWPVRADGLGAHEVIVESPLHDATWARMDDAALSRILVAWRERIADLGRDRRMRAVVVFKNHGVQAGARLAHPHSQLVAMPVVPPALEEELTGAARYHADHGSCAYCDLVARDLDEGVRLIQQSPGAVALAPFAARTPFQVWVLPKSHAAHFAQASDDLLREVASLLRTLLERVEAYLEGPAYNVVLHTAPYGHAADASFHWHLEIVPRVFRVTGLDLGAGLSINPVTPEEAARVLRRARKPGA